MAETYPLSKFYFEVNWGGANMGLTEITGLEFETDVIEYRAGDSKEFHKIKMPGLRKFTDITMKRGTFRGDNEFFSWWQESVAFNTIERRPMTINLLDEGKNPAVIWKVVNAWAKKIQASDLKSDSSETAIETIEVVHEGLEIEHVGGAAAS